MDNSKQPMNMRVLKRSREKRFAGEIFVLSFRKDEFYWGRVISTLSTLDGKENVNLCYVYHISTISIDTVPLLDKSQLLIPPFCTDQDLWRRGYFKTIENRPLSSGDIHPTHCFKIPDTEIYHNEFGEVLPGRLEPCGVDMLHDCAMIDETLSGVLGFPISPMT